MKNKALLLSLFGLIAVLIGAAFLYNQLSPDLAPEQLSTQMPSTQTPSATSTDAPVTDTPIPTEEPPVSAAPTSDATEPSSTEPPLAPDFTVYDRDGVAHKLSDYRGKPVVLNFWASWCGPCQSEMPDFDAAYKELGEEVHFLMVNMTDGSRETLESASQFIDNSGYSFPVFYDTDYEAAIAYSVYSLPTTYFLDAEGHGIAQATGAINAETLQRGIDMIYNANE